MQTVKIFERNRVDMLREERKQNHVKCSMKTREGKKGEEEINNNHKEEQTWQLLITLHQ